MANLKELKARISSVKSTQRITSAMKMVAAAKLRKAQDMAEAARPYAERIERMLGSLAAGASSSGAPAMLTGTGKDDTHLLVIVTSDRGLCGGFNGSIIRAVRRRIIELQADGKTVKLLIIGRKGVGLLRREFRDLFVEVYEELAKPIPTFEGAATVADKVTTMFEAGEFDVCTVYYNKFVSALTQVVTPLQLIPFAVPEGEEEQPTVGGAQAIYEFEPEEEKILAALLPKNLSTQIYRAMLESFAGEQGARMTAMDNATRNAGDMINSLSITYNRTRQAQITKELIEIISGAEAL
ncbi:F0F1 ATP synthase subunit gamma [Hwanghaeella grinnelliae]|uniref:ATP synthase gamma chain n=1 Tax=Hwanghaeella grinnelliae TaxID=2500179 RepID=A0A3S2W527_9PROT|nr:F0F1 ATP synthase subunit gamma [Hwanghaeella grinnelliae]RVU36672.1 F0F1 ATP synthase subunit gamma [Hwanghaeella grinnelliae]